MSLPPTLGHHARGALLQCLALPFLGVTAVLVVPSFPERARVRVDEQCLVIVPAGRPASG